MPSAHSFRQGREPRAREPWRTGALVLAVVLVASVGTTRTGGTLARQTPAQASAPLTSVIDIHVHTLPDRQGRSIDAIDLAKLARSRGMRGLVLKNHYESTASQAYLVRKEVPGLEVFGGIDLNLAVGGINVEAVDQMRQVTGGWGRIVWFPTFDAEYYVRGSTRPFVRVSSDGELLPAVKEVIGLIAKYGLVLETGHSSPEESLMLVREGRRQGVRHIAVTHAINLKMTVAQMQEAAKEGAFIEFCAQSLVAAHPSHAAGDFAAAIRQVGSASVILSTDLGQPENPLPPDGMATLFSILRGQGFTEQELGRMSKDNPARLLGLSAP
jgi:Family of unknown function (DUF6282)